MLKCRPCLRAPGQNDTPSGPCLPGASLGPQPYGPRPSGGSRWRHICCNSLPAANLLLGGASISTIPFPLQTCCKMAPESVQSPSCCKHAARWHQHCCNPNSTANMPLGGATISAIPSLLQVCRLMAPQWMQSPSHCKPAARWLHN